MHNFNNLYTIYIYNPITLKTNKSQDEIIRKKKKKWEKEKKNMRYYFSSKVSNMA